MPHYTRLHLRFKTDNWNLFFWRFFKNLTLPFLPSMKLSLSSVCLSLSLSGTWKTTSTNFTQVHLFSLLVRPTLPICPVILPLFICILSFYVQFVLFLSSSCSFPQWMPRRVDCTGVSSSEFTVLKPRPGYQLLWGFHQMHLVFPGKSLDNILTQHSNKYYIAIKIRLSETCEHQSKSTNIKKAIQIHKNYAKHNQTACALLHICV